MISKSITSTYDFSNAHAPRGKKRGGSKSSMARTGISPHLMASLSLNHLPTPVPSSRDRLLSPVDPNMVSQRYFGLSVLFALNTINFLDRYSTAAVLTDIQKYYSLNNFLSGLLSTCFLFGYMLTAPVFGYLGDKYTRKWILVGGVIFWSFAAFAGSIIGREYYYLFVISRILVGVGEASYSTIAPTIIADLFEPEKRKLGLSIFYFAIPIGSGLGFLMGTLAISLGDWRWIFRITPAIGLIAAGALLFLTEPIRGQSDGGVAETRDTASVPENVGYLISIRSYVWATVGFTCCLFTMGALSWWSINFMGAARGQEYEQTATLIFGGIVCAAGFVGVTLGSGSATYYRKYDGRADPIVCAVGIFVSVPLTLLGLVFARSVTWLSWILLFFSVTALSTNWAVVSDMVLSVTLPSKRAFATAIQILITHLLGDAASPTIIGYIRDELNTSLNDDFLAFLYALLSTLIILTLGGIAFLFSAKYYERDVENCKATITGGAIGEERVRTGESNLTDFATLT